MKRIDQKLAVSFEFPVIFTNHIFDPANASLADAIDRLREEAIHRMMVFVDGNVTQGRPELIGAISAIFKRMRATCLSL